MRRTRMLTMEAPTTADRRAVEIETFLADNGGRLVGALTLITGSRAGAEDALQDALVKAWDRRDQPIDSLAGWITVVATNNARSGWRRRQAEQRALDKVGGRAALHSEQPVVADEALDRALRSLPLRERQVAVLHYVLDQSVADIALTLNVSDGTVKTLLSRARGHLSERLTAMSGDDDGGSGASNKRRGDVA